MSSALARGANLIFLGAPGVGKGTFASRVAKKLGIPAISTGDIIRSEIKAGSALGKELAAVTNSGGLVSDAVVTGMVRKRLAAPDAQPGFILVRDDAGGVRSPRWTLFLCAGGHAHALALIVYLRNLSALLTLSRRMATRAQYSRHRISRASACVWCLLPPLQPANRLWHLLRYLSTLHRRRRHCSLPNPFNNNTRSIHRRPLFPPLARSPSRVW